jgi:hypothetical protein
LGIIQRNRFFENQWIAGWAIGTDSSNTLNDGAGTTNRNYYINADGSTKILDGVPKEVITKRNG